MRQWIEARLDQVVESPFGGPIIALALAALVLILSLYGPGTSIG